VFPCKPKSKEPLLKPKDGTKGGFHTATLDESQVRAWWTDYPKANVAFAPGVSCMTVIDMDHGCRDEAEARAWLERSGLPHTFTVHTGRRWDQHDPEKKPEYGLQLYFQGAMSSTTFEIAGGRGEIRSSTGHVMAVGSIHDVSGECYELLIDAPVAALPEFVKALGPPMRTYDSPDAIDEDTADDWKTWLLEYMDRNKIEIRDDGKRVANGWWFGIMCPWADQHSSGPGALNSTVLGILDGKVTFNCEHHGCKSQKRDTAALKQLMTLLHNESVPEPGADVQVVLGTGKTAERLAAPKEPVDWHTRYMTEESYLNVKPPEFLIDGFLVKDSIAMLGGPVAQRKSIIALNVAHALCTGDALFGYFKVAEKPTRTVYLCPEMGAASFVKRIKQIGLGGYVGKTLFIQTMSEQPTVLDELDGELPGSVVIVDTITRFIEGDENKSEDMRRFAQKVFRLVNAGATVVLLHHSKKGSAGTLDDGLRGSSELAAFVDSCWVTELDDPTKPYESLSKIRNVKQRDFESDPFRLKPAPGSFYLTMEGDPAPEAVIRGRKEQAARDALAEILSKLPKAGINKLRDELKGKGYGKGQKWVTAARYEILGGGATLSSD
jgi:hypothetical protein